MSEANSMQNDHTPAWPPAPLHDAEPAVSPRAQKIVCSVLSFFAGAGLCLLSTFIACAVCVLVILWCKYIPEGFKPLYILYAFSLSMPTNLLIWWKLLKPYSRLTDGFGVMALVA